MGEGFDIFDWMRANPLLAFILVALIFIGSAWFQVAISGKEMLSVILCDSFITLGILWWAFGHDAKRKSTNFSPDHNSNHNDSTDE